MDKLLEILTDNTTISDHKEIVISISGLNINQEMFGSFSINSIKKYILIYIDESLYINLVDLNELMDMRENTEQCRIYNTTQEEINKVMTLHVLDIKLSEAIYEVILKDKELIFLNYGE